MKKASFLLLGAIVLIALVAGTAANAATPPTRLNYQGVLRDNTPGNEDTPLSGSFDMVFRFFDDADPMPPENEILVDAHEAAGSGAVTVSGGLFNATLGAGTVTDGTGAGSYNDLAQVFGDFADVYLEISVNGEILTPRTRVVSAAYALNSSHLDGAARSDFIDTSAAAQTKSGNLTVGELTASGNKVWVGQAGAGLDSGAGVLYVRAGTQPTDELRLLPGNGLSSNGELILAGGGDFYYRATANHRFFSNLNPSTETAFLDGVGNLKITGAFTASFGLMRGETGLSVRAGNADTDDLFLYAGNGQEDGSVLLLGGGLLRLRAGNGLFEFRDAANVLNASLDAAGNFDIAGTYTGDGSGLTGVDADTFGGSLPADFVDVSATAQIKAGDLSVADLTVSGDDLVFGAGPGIHGLAASDGWELTVPAAGLNASRIRHDDAGSLGEASGFVFDGGTPGLIIESLLGGEGSGIFMNGDFMSLWSPGDLDRLLRVYDEDGMVERFWIDGDGDAYTRGVLLTSSRSRKQNIAPLVDSLGKLSRLQGVSFEWRPEPTEAGEAKVAAKLPEKSIGFIAEDVAQVFPELVTWEPDGRTAQGLNYSALIAVAVEAVKELGARVAADLGSVAARTPDPVTGVQQVEGNLQVVLDRGADDESRFSIVRDGAERSVTSEVFRVDERGNVFAMGSFRPNAMDLAEYFAVSEPVEPGDVVAVDPEHEGSLHRARDAGDGGVVGIVSTDPGVLLGAGVQRVLAADAELARQLQEARAAGDTIEENRLWQALLAGFAAGNAPVALSGTAHCKVDAGYGAIRPGDLLVASPTAGHAMRTDEPRPGTILGKALESLDAGTGTIRVLVMLR